MASNTADPPVSDIGDLEESLDAIYQQAEAMLSESSIPSTATASDLPGIGRTLGKLYSFLGRRLEDVLGRLAERCGYGPKAIEQRILGTANPVYDLNIPEPGSKEDKRLRRDLKQLIAYAGSKIVSNRELACQVIISIVFAGPQFREMLRTLGVTRALGLVCVREERSGASDCLLSPSRKALVCVAESNIIAIGEKRILLRRRHGSYPGKLLCALKRETAKECGEYCGFVNIYAALVEHIGSCYPEQSFLAMLYYTDCAPSRRHIATRLLSKDIDSDPEFMAFRLAYDKSREVRSEIGRLHEVNENLARSIHRNVQQAPSDVDWDALGFTIVQLHDHLFPRPDTWKSCLLCYGLLNDILVRFSDNFSPEVKNSIKERNDALREDLKYWGRFVV